MKITTFLVSFFVIQFLVISSVLAETSTYTKDGNTYITTTTTTGTKTTTLTKIYDESGNLVTRTPKPLLPTTAPQVKVYTEITEPPVKVYLQTEYPVTVSKDSGNLVVTTTSGEVELKRSPDDVFEQAKVDGLDIVVDVKLDEGSGALKYVVDGVKLEKFLAIFDVTLDTKLVYDPQTGVLNDTIQSTWSKVADFLSI